MNDITVPNHAALNFAEGVRDLEFCVQSYAGWPHVEAAITNGVLAVSCGNSEEDIQYSLTYDTRTRRETYGRLGAIGLASRIDTIHELAAAH